MSNAKCILHFALGITRLFHRIPALHRAPGVLTLLADRQRQLLVLDDDFHHALAVVDDRHALHFRGTERVGDEGDRIFRPFDDVDFFATELADDRLDTRTLHADARANRIDVALARVDGDLRAIARFAHRAANHHRAVVNLGHLLLEQLDEQRRIGTRQNDLRSLGAAVHALDDGAHAVAGCIAFGARLFLARQHRLDAADLQDDVAVLEALDRPVDDLADPLVVLGEDVLALGLADLLKDHLLGRLRGNAAQHFGRLREFHLVAELDAVGNLVSVERAIHLARFVDGNLGGRAGHLFDDGLQREQIHLSGLGVEPRLQVLARLVVLAGRRRDGLLDGADDGFRLDALFFREGLDRLLQRIRHLEFHFQVRARNHAERHAVPLLVVGINQDLTIVDAAERPPEKRRAIYRLAHHELRAASGEAAVIV